MQIPSDDPRLLQIDLRADLVRLGHTDRSLAAAVRRGELDRPRRGAYVSAAEWAQLSSEQRYAVRARAVERQARTEVILSHTSAVPFHDGPLWGQQLEDVHVTRRDGLTGRKERGVRQHRGQLRDDDVVAVHDFQVSAPARTVLECATVASVESALVVANDFLHRGLVTPQELHERYDEVMAHWPQSLGTPVVLRLADPRIESVGESRTLYFLYRSSLPKPIPQFEIWDGLELVAKLDFALPEHGIWLEFDGRVKYERFLRPGESPADAVVREKLREDRVAELTGWRCLRLTWTDLADPARLAARIRALIESVARATRRAS
ncbi:type IV toxin-antitoxin system AbiEi family antitoxin domain-containing protein [Nocardioides sp. L-11A]|uniref:type IV toxin-antitoxin system AbiEi family antitoxin domain-containing protein n=1 Tax=Nocardioides sp. L-11A TaxID=3043848 RepID=UPI00249B5378|nr:type IV toxin-antitoxin system AbiEi family antitoxin domain-containing protein [Nocardioides sp. L-11A]